MKRLKPFGVLVVLIIGLLTIVTLFTIDLGAPPPYTPEHDTAYYQQSPEHMAELLREVREHVVPNVPGIVDTSFDLDDYVIVLIVEPSEHDKIKAVISRDFDPVLFDFKLAQK